jgi:hypothetical protein
MLLFLDVIGKAIGDHPMFFSYRKMRKKKTLGNHPMIFFLDVQGEAEGLKKQFLFIFILFFKSEKTSRNHLMFFPLNVGREVSGNHFILRLFFPHVLECPPKKHQAAT